MIVYVESNFILEMVLGQTQAPSAIQVLELAESHEIAIIAELNAHNCHYERSFGKGLNFIRSCL